MDWGENEATKAKFRLLNDALRVRTPGNQISVSWLKSHSKHQRYSSDYRCFERAFATLDTVFFLELSYAG